MESLTKNEARIMDFLIRHDERNSINQIAKRLQISPMGAYKILKKLEKMKAVKAEKIGNASYYQFNPDEEIAIKMGELVLVQNELNSYAKVQAEDFKRLKPFTHACILYGSVLSKGKDAGDIDAIIILDKEKFDLVKKQLEKLKDLKPKKIHDILMTSEDLASNLKGKNPAIIDAIKTGKVLWGSEVILEAIKNGTSRK